MSETPSAPEPPAYFPYSSAKIGTKRGRSGRTYYTLYSQSGRVHPALFATREKARQAATAAGIKIVRRWDDA